MKNKKLTLKQLCMIALGIFMFLLLVQMFITADFNVLGKGYSGVRAFTFFMWVILSVIITGILNIEDKIDWSKWDV